MKTARKGAWLLGVCAVFVALGARAESLSPNAAVAYALVHNPDLRADGEQVAAAGERARAEESARLPQIDARYVARRSDNPLDVFADKLNTRSVNPGVDFSADALNHPSTNTLYNAGLVLEWPLYTGGRREAGIRAARENERATSLGHERLREVIAFQTLSAYRRAQATQAAVTLAEDAQRAARQHASTTARLLAQNRIVPSDKLSAEVYLSLVESQRERAVMRQLNALTQLKQVMGMPFDAALDLEPWDENTPSPSVESLADLEARALDRRRDIAAAQSLFDAARSRVGVARAAGKPNVSLFAAENWYDDTFGLDNRSFSVGAALRLSLYSGGRDTAQISAAQHDANEREERLEALRQKVRQEVREAYYAFNEARARVNISADNANKAQRTVELVRARYGEGRTILIDLLQAERVLVEARAERLAAALDLALAGAALELAGGTLALPP